MTPYFAIFALLLQVALVHCDETIEPQATEDVNIESQLTEPVDTEPQTFYLDTPEDNFYLEQDNLNLVEEPNAGPKDFYDLFFGNNGPYSNGQSVQLMEEATKDSTLPAEEQCVLIKDTAQRIAACIEEELVGVLSYIIADAGKGTEENGNRQKRSTDSPVDYSKMVMRLLNHLKSSNEDQNIAIEKMMSAQEIANKYGIDYEPEADSIQNIFDATEKKNEDIIAFLTQSSESNKDVKNSEPVADESAVKVESVDPNYYHYDVDEDVYEVTVPPQHLFPAPHCHYSLHPYCETQVRPPPVQYYPHQEVSQRPPAFYEPQPYQTPASFNHHHQHHEHQHHEHQHHEHQHHEKELPEIAALIVETTIEPEQEPELTGEEFEETVSSKVTVDKGDEPEAQDEEKEEKERKNVKTDRKSEDN